MNPDEEKNNGNNNVITPAGDPAESQLSGQNTATPDGVAMPADSAAPPTMPAVPDLDATGDAPSQSFDQSAASPDIVSSAPDTTAPTPPVQPDTMPPTMPEQSPAMPPDNSMPTTPVEQPVSAAPVAQKSGPKALVVVLLAVILITAGAAVAYFGGLFG